MHPTFKKLLFYGVSALQVFAANLWYLLFYFEEWTRGATEADFVYTFPDSIAMTDEALTPLLAVLYPTLFYTPLYNNGYFRPTGSW